ncbi:MAG: autotransporter outer membrane beta-barrel domain-containing protein [Endomicrobiaceae bacterium]|nr:autotransporter outer membrane beta-barrel domain-containing protein [Endomicrobiaceae bacterium]
MKKLVVGSLVFVLTAMLFTNVFAETKSITEYCGNNGLLLRRGSPIESGDVLNITKDIKQESDITSQIPANRILSEGIKINGNGHKLDGNDLGGFIMEQLHTGVDTDSEINNATLQHYDQNIADAVIDVKQPYTSDNFSLTLNNVTFSSNSCVSVKVQGSQEGEVILNNCSINGNGDTAIELSDYAYLIMNNVNISSNSGSALSATNSAEVKIYSTRDIYFKDNGRKINLSSSWIYFTPNAGTTIYSLDGIEGSGSTLYIGNFDENDNGKFSGTLALGGNNNSFSGNVVLSSATIKLLANSKYFGSSYHDIYSGTLDILNNSSDTVNMNSIYGTDLKINLDVNLDDTDYSDYIQVSDFGMDQVIINKINVTSDSVSDVVDVEVISSIARSSTTLASSQKRVFGPLYGYDVYISSTGSYGEVVVATSTVAVSTTGHILTFQRAQDSYNPDILQGKVAIAGASISQEEIFDTVLNNAGNYTFFQKQGSSAGDVEDRAAPTLWVKAFGSQEDVDLEKYTKLKTTYYGAVVGLDWDRQYTDNFDATYGIFASYIGGELKDDEYSSNKVKQNGGYAGFRANWYIGKLFINGIADYGLIQNSADTTSDSNDFNSQVIGLAARLGYNFEVARRSFTIQPSVGVTGKYIITDDFETIVSSGDKFKEKIDDIKNITVEPGLKLVKNLGKCWILSGEGKYVIENVSGDVKITAEDLELVLPDMSYKNYANVGLGIEKIWGYTVLHLKGNKTFGGRDGFIVNAGIEFKF